MAKLPPTIRALELARVRLDESLAATPDDPRLLVLRGRADERLEQHEAAAGFFERAAVLFSRIGDRAGEAGALVDAASALARCGAPSKPWELFERAVHGFERLRDETGATRARVAQGRARLAAGQPLEARTLLESALGPLEAQQDWDELGATHEQLSRIRREAGDGPAALEHARAAVECAAKSKDRAKWGQRLALVAALHHDSGNLVKARQYQERAQPYLLEAGDTLGVLAGYEVLAEAALEGEPEAARALVQQAVDYADQIGRPGFQGRLRVRWAWLELESGEVTLARHLLDRAVALLHTAGDPRASAPAFVLLAEACRQLGQEADSRRALDRAEAFYRMLGDDAGARDVARMRQEAEADPWSQ